MNKLFEMPHAYERELASEIEELEVLLALARACQAAAAILESPTTKTVISDAIQAIVAALNSAVIAASVVASEER